MATAPAGPISRSKVSAATRVEAMTSGTDRTRRYTALSADVADGHDDDADHQRTRDGARGVDGLLRGVGDHVPAAEGEEPGGHRQHQPGEIATCPRDPPAPKPRHEAGASHHPAPMMTTTAATFPPVITACTRLPVRVPT